MCIRLARESREVELVNVLHHFWETESIGIKETAAEGFNNVFPPDVVFDCERGRHQVSLPWKLDIRPRMLGWKRDPT